MGDHKDILHAAGLQPGLAPAVGVVDAVDLPVVDRTKRDSVSSGHYSELLRFGRIDYEGAAELGC